MDADLLRSLRFAADRASALSNVLTSLVQKAPAPPIDTLFLDMDGVLVDFVQGALDAHAMPHCKLTPGEWAIEKAMGLTLTHFWARLQGVNFWRELMPTHDWLPILATCQDYFRPDRIFLLTSPCLDPYCYTGKYEWVQKWMPHFERRFILSARKDIFARPGAVLIDDKEETIDKWRDRGGEGFLCPRGWNRQHADTDHAVPLLRLFLQGLSGRITK